MTDARTSMPEKCGATKRDGSGESCGLPAGWGTDHVGEGRCKHHDGPGAPEGNKNAVTTGEHETIYTSTLDGAERALYEGLDTDQLVRLDHEIRLIAIRERRMMQRIADLKDKAFTVVEKKSKEGHGPKEAVDIDEEKLRATLGQIQDIEAALTRVQREHRQMLWKKYRILKDQPADRSEKLGELLSRMASMRDETQDYQPPEIG
jgi:hypothetical protein